jgi:sigma-B regulation protein RsbU (phosphoserine phosphatase)
MDARKQSAPRSTTVLLIDDQAIIGEAVRRMVAGEEGLEFHFSSDGAGALETAARLQPTVILQDLVMPDVDGLELVRRFRADERFGEVPIVVLSSKEEPAVKAEAFQRGANDYLVKLPDRLELLARIRHHSRGYIALLERNEAFRALEASRRLLAADLESAARHVRALLPPPQRIGAVAFDWRFAPCADLGGDAFGYHAIDDDHVAFYLLDVCGHGVAAALLGVSAINAIRSGALPRAEYRRPGTVLEALNRAFPMERQNDMFFTIWYGVHQASTGILRWAGGGHPAALLLPPEGAGPPRLLESDGPLVGAVEGLEFTAAEIAAPAGSRLYVYSDGAFEITRPDGSMWGFAEFARELAEPLAGGGSSRIDRVLDRIQGLSGHGELADDFSMMEVAFGGDGREGKPPHGPTPAD